MTNSNRSARTPKKRGQGLLEFALILPLLLLVLSGIVDMGWIAFNYSQLFNGVREGTRFGSVTGFGATPQYLDCNAIAQKVISYAGFSGITSSDITIYYDDGRAASGTVDPNNTSTWGSTVVGVCKDGAFVANSAYTPLTSSDPTFTPPARPDPLTHQYVVNGDRVVILVNGNLHFLTPFIRTFAQSGLTVKFTATRSVFPSGLAA